ncbi:MAG TPA: metallophosphoesterase family protein [Longimicrobium sp.]
MIQRDDLPPDDGAPEAGESPPPAPPVPEDAPPAEPQPEDAPAPVAEPQPAREPAAVPTLGGSAGQVNVLEVRELDWDAIRAAVSTPFVEERAERIIQRIEQRLAGGGPVGLAFEEYADGPDDRAVLIGEDWPVGEVWFVGDLHGDLLALESALQHIDRSGGGADARIVFLGDLFDDGVHSAEVVLRVFELLLDGPMRVTVVTGNHDDAVQWEDGRFQSTVLPSDFTDWLNQASADGHPWAERLGRAIVHFFRRTPRALFFPDGLLVAHGGIPHTDLHPVLAECRDWNDPRVLQDFVWLRAHPRARKRIPNRTTRGSEFGREDFAAFCQVATRLGRPVSRMLRGHDHVEERFEAFPAWAAHPALTINTLSHRLPREVFGPYERVPVVARWVRGELPEVRRLFIPPELIREIYPEPGGAEEAG